jgi:hypothetical protein
MSRTQYDADLENSYDHAVLRHEEEEYWESLFERHLDAYREVYINGPRAQQWIDEMEFWGLQITIDQLKRWRYYGDFPSFEIFPGGFIRGGRRYEPPRHAKVPAELFEPGAVDLDDEAAGQSSQRWGKTEEFFDQLELGEYKAPEMMELCKAAGVAQSSAYRVAKQLPFVEVGSGRRRGVWIIHDQDR